MSALCRILPGEVALLEMPGDFEPSVDPWTPTGIVLLLLEEYGPQTPSTASRRLEARTPAPYRAICRRTVWGCLQRLEEMGLAQSCRVPWSVRAAMRLTARGHLEASAARAALARLICTSHHLEAPHE